MNTIYRGGPIEPRDFKRSWDLRCHKVDVCKITVHDGPALYLPAIGLEANVAAVHLAIDLWTRHKIESQKIVQNLIDSKGH